uniref:Toxin candidate TRINITY_DN34258_c3_g4_i4 n=1 Tax=Pachycerianthus borealis TaxID=2736680 RepID=A0A7G7WYY6_9CNID|nr:toxin candidate TRINITY_DN34258_c3_g4_i4 [Pachycerianthus borealis]
MMMKLTLCTILLLVLQASSFPLDDFDKRQGKTSGQAVLIKGIAGPCLQVHNQYRAQHSAPALTLDSNLTSSSEELALLLANTKSITHHGGYGIYGENIGHFWLGPSLDDPVQLCQEAVKRWYAENHYFDFDDPFYSAYTKHFTQVVWKSSTKLGMAIAKIPENYRYNGYYVVARYTPPKSLIYLKENVLPKN